MKRILIAIAVLAGVGGLIALLSYHPKTAADAVNPAKSPAATPTALGASSAPAGGLKDGTYTGSSQEISYGTVQVAAVVSGGKITAVNFVQMPSGDEHTNMVTREAEPALQQEALTAQSANVNLVTGATQDSRGFINSLQSALNQAKA